MKAIQVFLLAFALILLSACFNNRNLGVTALPKTGIIFRIQPLGYTNKITVSTSQGRFLNFNVKTLEKDLFIGQKVKFIIKNNNIIGITSAALPVY